MEKYRGRNRYIPSRWQNSRMNNNTSESVAIEKDDVRIKSENINTIGQSGNSDVDVQVEVFVDTTPIAFAILTSLLATKQLTVEEFNEAIRRLENLTQDRDFNGTSFLPNNVSDVKLFTRNNRRPD
jgi:predicted negative regulator of RcsB-dependent stress response